MIIEATVPVLTTTRAQKDKKQKLQLTNIPFSFDFNERASAELPIVARWIDGDEQEHVIRRSEARGPFLALMCQVPSGDDRLEIDFWDAYDRIEQCVTANGRYTKADVQYASAGISTEAFDELIDPDLGLIEQQIQIHSKDLAQCIVVDGAIYEPCDQPYLALLEDGYDFTLEPRLEYFDIDRDPLAKFSLADGENVRRWLAANHPSFQGGANDAAYLCTRPDLFDDKSVSYVSYSLAAQFASGVYNSSKVSVQCM